MNDQLRNAINDYMKRREELKDWHLDLEGGCPAIADDNNENMLISPTLSPAVAQLIVDAHNLLPHLAKLVLEQPPDNNIATGLAFYKQAHLTETLYMPALKGAWDVPIVKIERLNGVSNWFEVTIGKDNPSVINLPYDFALSRIPILKREQR